MTDPAAVLSGFERDEFTFDSKRRTVWRSGDGPGVVVMAEMPGITPRVVEFAERVRDRGLTVVLPHLFGEPGEPPGALAFARSLPPACVSREFAAFALRRTPPAVDWLRALCRDTHERCGGPGVGAVGMCFTGGFALAMATEPALLAPVLSQPSLPIGLGAGARGALNISDADLLAVKERSEEEDLCVLGLRFTGDRLVPAERFATLRRELGDRFLAVEIDSSKGNGWGHRATAHSVLTEDLVDEPGQPTGEALEQVLDFLATRLLPATPAK